MRRSSAPSCKSNAKKAKFQTPLKTTVVENNFSQESKEVAEKFEFSLSQSQTSLEDEADEKGNNFEEEKVFSFADKNKNVNKEVRDTAVLNSDCDKCTLPKTENQVKYKKPVCTFKTPIVVKRENVSTQQCSSMTVLPDFKRNENPEKQSDHQPMLNSGNSSGKSTFEQWSPVSSFMTELDNNSTKSKTMLKTNANRAGKTSFRASFKSPAVNRPDAPSKQLNDVSTNDVVEEKYYSVVWCKASNKKHKKWEGDGLLVVHGRQVFLKDTEGKGVGKSSSYKSSELKGLVDGSTLVIGGKEIEVQGIVEKEAFMSGRCFTSIGEVSPAPTVVKVKNTVVKPFVAHKVSEKQEMLNVVKYTARFNPDTPNALVMPRIQCGPTAASEIIDVVVDPFIGSSLRDHQREGVTFLYKCIMGGNGTGGNGAILADEMGLGKTLQCITLVWTLLKQGPYKNIPISRKVVIVTPGSLVKNWRNEFIKWLGSARIQPFTVDSQTRVDEFLLRKLPVMIISYEMFLRCIEDIRKVGFDLMICDEAHRLKNAAIKTATEISALNIRRRVLLTGTPVQNNLMEFYALAELANPGVLGSQSSFKRVFVAPITASQQPNCTEEEKQLGECRTEQLTELTCSFCLRRTADINKKYLPPKVEHVYFIQMSDLQKQLYTQLLKSRLVRNCIGSTYSGCAHLVCIGMLKKVCNDPKILAKSLTESTEEYIDVERLQCLLPDDLMTTVVEHSSKLKVLECMLRNSKEKIVLVSNSTKTLDVLATFCKHFGHVYVRLDGQTNVQTRQQIVNRFNDLSSDIGVFLLSSKAGGVGLNLIGASSLVLFDIDWNPANDLQAMARLWRDGQRKQVNIYRFLIAGSIEEKIYQRQIIKQVLSKAVVDSLSTGKTEFSREDLRDLFTFRETTSCSTHELLQCNCLHDANSETFSIERSNATYKTKNASMAELMRWEHLSSPDDQNEDLDGIVSFVFRNRTN